METLETINKRLRDFFGTDVTGLYPKYRVVWSDSQRELRKAEFNAFLGNIFLGTRSGVFSLPKYPFIKARHVFEIYCPTDNPELVEGFKNYEPIYVFEDKSRSSLSVVWWACERIGNVLSKGESSGNSLLTEEEEDLKLYKEYFDILDDTLPEIPSRIVRGEGTVLDKTAFWEN
jgi:hypothetical protein